MRDRGFPQLFVAGVVCALLLALAVKLALGGDEGNASSPAPASAIALIGGVPVGVRDTPAGALAAADNYVALGSQTVEQDPRTFAALVAQAYAPQIRARALSEAQRIRANDALNMDNYAEGGRGLAIVAARRLDSYTPAGAQVTTWLGGTVWGPHLPPAQTWNLVDTVLRWQAGRWLVLSCKTEATPAPVPSVVYVTSGNNHVGAFARLNGMSAPFYGVAE
jgi:hypothetical protein